jgi:hypothetical protein
MKILDTPRSGKCGNAVAFQSRYGLCLRTYLIPRNTLTPAREHMRAVFGSASRMWSGKLTEEQRDRWNAAGPNVMSHPRLAQKGPLTGQQFWQAINSVRGCVGLSPAVEPPAPVAFGPSVVGRLTITNDENGVRLWLAVSGEPSEDVMLFGQEPCPSGRSKRRNVAYLGLVPPPTGGMTEITHLYTARYGEPRPGRKVFIVTCQQKNGWKGLDRETSAIVPNRPETQPPVAEPTPPQAARPDAIAPTGAPALAKLPTSHIPYMHKGGTRAVQGTVGRADSQSPAVTKPQEQGGRTQGTTPAGVGGGGPGPGSTV